MPLFVGRYDPSVGVFLQVILVPRAFALVHDSPPMDARDLFPGGIVRPFKAQFDTGAQVTCLTKKAIDHYQMTPNGRTEIISVSGKAEVNTYIFTLGFLMGSTPDKTGSTATGNFSFFEPVQGAEIFTDDDDDLEVLIGMDVISKGTLHIDPFGQFTFWF